MKNPIKGGSKINNHLYYTDTWTDWLLPRLCEFEERNEVYFAVRDSYYSYCYHKKKHQIGQFPMVNMNIIFLKKGKIGQMQKIPVRNLVDT